MSLLAALMLFAGSTGGEPSAADLSKLTDQHRSDLRCSAAFAIIASEQARGVESALAFPALDWRGREFFVMTGARVIDEAKIDRLAVKGLMQDEVALLQQEAINANDPESVVADVMTPCLARLDAVVPPLEKPSLAQCTAFLELAYQEVYAREKLSATAKDLKTLASVLEARAREALTAEGKSKNETDRYLVEIREKILKDAFDKKAAGGLAKYDIAHCYELAKPEEKSGHY